MANTAQARKRARQNDKQRAHNASLKSAFRTAIKKVIKAISLGDKKVAKETFDANVAIIDRIADKKIVTQAQQNFFSPQNVRGHREFILITQGGKRTVTVYKQRIPLRPL